MIYAVSSNDKNQTVSFLSNAKTLTNKEISKVQIQIASPSDKKIVQEIYQSKNQYFIDSYRSTI